jgi:zinc protease
MNMIKKISPVLILLLFVWSCKTTKNTGANASDSPPAIEETKPAPDAVGAIKLEPKDVKPGGSILPPTPEMPAGIDAKAEIPFDNTVRTGVLENGLTYYVKQNGKPENFAEFRLVVNAGSILEDEDQQGLAHFLEHMAFNGTRNFPKHELINFLESSGVKFGAHLNAYTSFDETVYMLRVPTDSAEQFRKGMQIIEDWASGILMEEEEIEAERGVVIEEWRLRLGADERMRQKTFPATFYNSRYAERLPIGKKEILETFKPETLRRFYRDWYRPDLMAVIVVGDIDVDQVEKQLKDRFNRIPGVYKKRERTYAEIPMHKETQIAVATDPEASYNVVQLLYKHPKKDAKTMLDYRSGLVSSMVNAMLDARLEELIQSENPPFSFAYTGYGNMAGKVDNFSNFAIVPDGGQLKALEAILVENARAMRHGFTQSELDRARKSMLTDLMKGLNEDGKNPSSRVVWAYVRHYLDNNPALNPQQQFALAKKLLPTISLEEVNFRITKWVTNENRVVTMTGVEKEGAPMPNEAQIREVLGSITGMEIEPYQDETADAPLMEKRPEPKAPVATMKNEALGTTELKFNNGVRVIFKPTNFKNDEIRFTAFSPGGSAMVKDSEYPSAAMSDAVVASSGMGPYGPQQMDKFMSDKVVRVSPYVGEIQEGFNGSSSVKDFETALQMIHLYCTEPRKDPAAFNSMMARQRPFIANRFNSPRGYFSKRRMEEMYDNHPRRQSMSTEFLDKVKLDDAYKIFKDRFGNASDFTFIFVGNIDEASFVDMAARYLGTLPGNGETEPMNDVGAYPVTGEKELLVRKGSEEQSTVMLTYHGDMEWNVTNMFEMNTVTKVLSIMLRESMREEQGGVYGVGVRPSRSHYPKETYSITVSFSCDPQNTNTLIRTVEEKIAQLQTEGPSAENMKKAQETFRKDVQVGMLDNGYWLNQLSMAYQNEVDPNEILNANSYIDALSAEKVQAAAKRYLNPSQRFKAVLMPEL